MYNAYKDNLATKPCKHFNYGEGICPFGSSCFYNHVYKDGRKWEPPPLTKIVNAEGSVSVPKGIKISDFLEQDAQDPFMM